MTKQTIVGKQKQSIPSRLVHSEVFGLLVALIAMILMFSLINHNYFSVRNLRTVLTGASLIGLICVGESLLLIGGGMDLSPGSTAAFAGIISALLLKAGLPFPVVMVAIVLLGAFIGMFNAFFITKLKINAFIATLATQSIVRGLCYILSGGESLLITDTAFLSMGTFKIIGDITFPIFFMLLMFVVFYIVMTRTRFGRNVYTVGGNPVAARLAGISTTKVTFSLFIIMGVLASVGGAILASRMNTGQPQACIGLEFDGITAAILGGVAMSGGVGMLTGSFVGLLILQGFNTGLTFVNVQSFWQYVARGGLMLLALSFDYMRSQKRRKA